MWVILFFGFLFGLIIQYARLNTFNVISRASTLEDFTMFKAMGFAIGLGTIILAFEIGLGFASFHVKPMILGGVIFGGLIFGAGMSILGYCPGTMVISVGEGALDALVGLLGGLLGGLFYTLISPSLLYILGPDYGAVSLISLVGSGSLFYIISIVIGMFFIGIAFWLNKKDETKNNKWLISGIGLAILNPIVFLSATSNRPIGASTSFPYVADFLTGFTQNDYFSKIKTPGHWEMIFLGGAVLAGLVGSLIQGNFKLKLIHSHWEEKKGSSKISRVIWAFAGGFILIFGARVAGGCASGHILSGGMQLAISSLVFAAFTFMGFLITGKLFYGKK